LGGRNDGKGDEKQKEAECDQGRCVKISDRLGTRELLSSTTASSIEADITGTTLVVSGTAISDFRAYAPKDDPDYIDARMTNVSGCGVCGM